MPPFIVFTLPRSRSAWLSHFLAPCGHDIALDCKSLADFYRILDAKRGTVETGSILGAKAIRNARPDIRMAVVRRPIDDVHASLRRIGLQVVPGELEHRAKLLEELAAETGVLTLNYEDLNSYDACNSLMQFCRGMPCSRAHFDHYSNFNIQLDIPKRVQKIIATAENIAKIKNEIACLT